MHIFAVRSLGSATIRRHIGFMNSPCINVCQIDPASGLCTGCLRTLDEIAAWAGLSADKRTEILADVERRAKSRNRTAGA